MVMGAKDLPETRDFLPGGAVFVVVLVLLTILLLSSLLLLLLLSNDELFEEDCILLPNDSFLLSETETELACRDSN